MRSYTALDYLAGGALAVPMLLFWVLAKIMPVSLASRFGGSLLAWLGPFSDKQRHVLNNLAHVRPDASKSELVAISKSSWRNFGSILAEYPHLRTITNKRIQLEIDAGVQEMLNQHQPVMILSAHLANWEVLAASFEDLGMTLNLVYAKNRNPFLEWAIQRFRDCPNLRYIDKSRALKEMLRDHEQQRSIGLLPDQRVDGGVMLDFFGQSAATTVSATRVALRLNYPIVPVQVERTGSARYKLTFHKPLSVTGTRPERAMAIEYTKQFYALLEDWITQDPGAWLCTKRRWPKVRPLGSGI